MVKGDYTQQRRRQCDHRGRDWNNAVKGQECLQPFCSLQKSDDGGLLWVVAPIAGGFPT